MPIPALLRTTLLLSSLGLTATYTLYETNPAFRAFVDRTLDQIATLWTDVLSALSPEERQRQRERQRHVFLGELGSRGVQGARDAAAALVPGTGSDGSARDSGVGVGIGLGSGIDVEGAGNDARVRRRALWEVAEENAAQIRERAAARGARASSSESTRSVNDETKYPEGATVFSADEDAGTVKGATAATALHSHPNPTFPDMGRSTSADYARVLTPAADADDVDFDDNASQTTASTEKFSRIMTPTSPSLHSVSEADMTESDLRDVDPMEDLRSDTGFERVADPPIAYLDEDTIAEDDDDPPMSDIGSLIDRSATPSTISLSDCDGIMSIASGSAFSDAGWATAESGDEDWEAASQHEQVRNRL